MYTLSIDIGNTRSKWGLFHHDELMQAISLANEDLDKNNLVFEEYKPEAIIVSSVNSAAEALLNLSACKGSVHHLSHLSRLNFNLDYLSPETLGKDRIAVVAAAKKLFPDQNCLIIDAGTCLTYDFLTSEGLYLGGAISPGIQLRLKSMNQYTNQLPLLNWSSSDRPESIGKTTITSMLSGVVNGIIGELKGFIADYERQYPSLQIVLTGGDANFFEKELKNGIFADPNLVLIGLHELLKYNRD